MSEAPPIQARPSALRRWLTKPYVPPVHRIPELDGLRVLLVFIVSWYHFWQQSWVTPYIGEYNLDFLIRAGYMPADGLLLLSGFLLFLPHARAMLLGERAPDVRGFYQRRAARIIPSYYLVTLLLLFLVAIPGQKYWLESDMHRDVWAHLTFTQTFRMDTLLYSPIGSATWTIAVEMQFYLLFPLLAWGARRNPLGMLFAMGCAGLGFRLWCLWKYTDYSFMVNQMPNFLDVYALGMGAALLYVKLTTLWPRRRGWQLLWSVAATAAIYLAVCELLELFRAQAASVPSTLQSGQMIRRPLFAALVAVIALSLPFALRPIRFLMGNGLMGVLAMASMNYYLFHKAIADYLKFNLQYPPSANYPSAMEPGRYPNNLPGGPEQPWGDRYMLLCFGLSLAAAFLATFLVEKPCAWLMKQGFRRLNAACDRAVARVKKKFRGNSTASQEEV